MLHHPQVIHFGVRYIFKIRIADRYMQKVAMLNSNSKIGMKISKENQKMKN